MTTGRINQVAAFWCTPAFEQARPQAAPYPDGLRQPECLRQYSQDRPVCSAARHRRPALSVFREAPLKHSSGTRPTIPKLSAAPGDGTGFAQVRPRRKLTSIEELYSEGRVLQTLAVLAWAHNNATHRVSIQAPNRSLEAGQKPSPSKATSNCLLAASIDRTPGV